VVSICRASALLKARGAAAAGEAWAAALEECASPSLRLTCLAGLALAEALQGRLCHARELGRAAEELADACNVPRERRPAAAPLALAWVACDMLQHTEARRWAALAEQSAVGYLEALVAPLLTLLRGRMLRSRHEVTAADDDVEPTASPAWLRELQLIARADAHLARDGADKAVLIVDALPDPHSPRAELLRDRAVACGARSTFELCDVTDRDDAALDVRVDAWINRAYAHLEQGQSAQAVAAAERALHLAEPEQLRRPFRQSSAQFRRLLRLNPQLTAAAAWLSQPSRTVITMRRPATGPPTAAAPQLVDAGSLTDRETEVLRLLAELMSTEEIGAAMFVSVNTVRTHIRSILRKLAVSRRNEAVRRARELALV
jgi:LuxR family maltose regulon positive regulatory protein